MAAMTKQNIRCAITCLQWTLGVVILIEAVMFVLPAAAPDFARTHMPNIIRLALGWGEIAGSILLLIPKTAVRGAWLLAAVVGLAIIVHLLHGMWNVGNIAIYAAAAWTVAAAKAV